MSGNVPASNQDETLALLSWKSVPLAERPRILGGKGDRGTYPPRESIAASPICGKRESPFGQRAPDDIRGSSRPQELREPCEVFLSADRDTLPKEPPGS